jgi:3-isopropylmalate/(R)-2-methylmalate dehydratase small subunit
VGLLLVERPQAEVKELMDRIDKNPGYTLTVDLDKQRLSGSDGWEASFTVDPCLKGKFLEGVDDIGYTLANYLPQIAQYELTHNAPWEAVLPEEKKES